MIPVIAIVKGVVANSTTAADNVGVGAILEAPFMLATIALMLVGASVLYFSERRLQGRHFDFDATATRRDLGFFIVGYSLALLAALLPRQLSLGPIPAEYGIGGALLVLYALYVYRSLRTGELIEDDGLESLYFGAVLENIERKVPNLSRTTDHRDDPHFGIVLSQAIFAIGFIIVGAEMFVTEVRVFSVEILHFPTAVLALLIAPFATELPEKLNSIIWISRDKDTLAIGNITGAMAFQSTIPVSLGVLFTSWNLTLTWGTTGFLNALSAILTLVSGGILYTRARSVGNGPLRPWPFLIGGVLYVLFIVVVVFHVFFLGVTVSGGPH